MKPILLTVLLAVLGFMQTGTAGDIKPLLQKAAASAEKGRTTEAMNALREAMKEVSTANPLSVSNATLVAKDAGSFGMYTARANNVFKAGEPILIYVEPVGYRFAQQGDEQVFGFSADFAVLSEGLEILAGQRKFQEWVFRSKKPLFEVFVNLTYNLTGAPPGKYFIETTFHDMNGGGQTSFKLPVEIQ